MLQVITNLIPQGHPNRPGIKLHSVKARVWHGTANLNSGAGDEANRDYFARPYTKQYNGYMKKYEYSEAGGSPFRFGSAHVIIDKDSATICIPLDEVSWGCGDRAGVYDKIYKGQQKLAKDMFNNEQNYQTINIELCMNDMVSIDKVMDNAVEFVRDYMPNPDIPDFRHFDLTYKNCPSFMVTQSTPDNLKWDEFKAKIRMAMDTLKDKRDHPIVMVNGIDITKSLTIRPYFLNGNTMVPVRIVEQLGATVKWDRANNTVLIESGK